MANPEEIDRRVAGTVMERMIPKDSPNQRNGVLASLGLVADTFEMLPTLEEAAGRQTGHYGVGEGAAGMAFHHVTSYGTRCSETHHQPLAGLADSTVTLGSDTRSEARLPRYRRAGKPAAAPSTAHRAHRKPQKQEPPDTRFSRQRPDG